VADRAALEARLGHRFTNPALLEEALTHASSSGRGRPTNERLEFLGDRVLGLLIARELVDRFPHEPEGALTKRLNVLVSRDTLAAVAGEIGLRRHLRMQTSPGRRAELTMVADACEALIGALFLDGGLEVAARFVLERFEDRLEAMVEAPSDPKMRLQELALGQGLPLPVYTVLRQEGPAHAPRFTVEVALPPDRRAAADGLSKRSAERAAAARLLEHLDALAHG
jgi:ribonuclease-3